MESSPARVHVIFAQAARIGLILRRGPTKHVATFLWNRETNEFTIGQWFCGRIYEKECHLSPDGKYFMYRAAKHSYGLFDWTAISRTPYLRAIALYQHAHPVRFTSNTTYRVGQWYGKVVECEEVRREGDRFGEGLVESFKRMRAFWSLPKSEMFARLTDIRPPTLVSTKVRRCGHGWALVHVEVGLLGMSHTKLIHETTGNVIDCNHWHWGDFDQGELVWSCDGVLYKARVTENGIEDEVKLFDFNPMKFEAIQAPYDSKSPFVEP